MKAGYYQVTSNDEDYLGLQTETAAGRAQEVNRRFLPGGVVQSIFHVGRKTNPAIKVGHGFFQNALRDYSEWRLKWWRECVQNSVDAGARHIFLTT